MICYEIYETAREDSARIFQCKDGHFRDIYDEVYSYLYYDLELSHEEAAQAADWCDMACVGEDYDADDIAITVYES